MAPRLSDVEEASCTIASSQFTCLRTYLRIAEEDSDGSSNKASASPVSLCLLFKRIHIEQQCNRCGREMSGLIR